MPLSSEFVGCKAANAVLRVHTIIAAKDGIDFRAEDDVTMLRLTPPPNAIDGCLPSGGLD